MGENFERRFPDQYMLRLPEGMRDTLKSAAAQNGRSMNSEIVDRLEKSLSKDWHQVTTTIYVLLDTDGVPTSWGEIHEHVAAISMAGQLNVSSLDIRVITPQLVASDARDREALELAKKYRALRRKTAAFPANAGPKRKAKA